VPEHAPLHPVNVYPLTGVAVSVTEVPFAKLCEQPVDPAQLIPGGLEATLPEPLKVTCSVSYTTTGLKLAPTLWLALLIVKMQVDALPEHPPLHPLNEKPDAGVSVRVTFEPLPKLWLQPLPDPVQLIPDGLDVTFPLPPTVTASESL